MHEKTGGAIMHTYSIDYSIRIGTRNVRQKETVDATTFSDAKKILQARYPNNKLTIFTVNEVRK